MASTRREKVELVRRVMRGCLASSAAFAADEAGQDVVEYGLIIATIAIVVLVGITAFGQQIEPWFQQLAGRITTTGT
jgi:Flp pilus assembly pilin Flp